MSQTFFFLFLKRHKQLVPNHFCSNHPMDFMEVYKTLNFLLIFIIIRSLEILRLNLTYALLCD